MYSSITKIVLLCLFMNIDISASEQFSCLSSQCVESEKPLFNLNHTYIYDYHIHIETQKASTNDSSSIDSGIFDSVVEIHADKFCNLILQLYNSTFYGFDENDNSSYKVKALSEDPLIFNYVDGKITKVCSKKSEPAWITNIKLGILSALQYTLNNISNVYNTTEENINGYCDSNYTTNEVDGWKIVRRYTNLDECDQRTTLITKNMNLFGEHDAPSINVFSKSIQKCRHVLGSLGVPILITCRENHYLTPFANGTNISLFIRQQMDLDRVVIKNELYSENDFTSNEYQYAFRIRQNNSITNETEKVLKYITSFKGKHDKFDENYIKYIDILRSLSFNQMVEISNTSKSQEKEFFFESLVNVINMNSFNMTHNAYMKGEISNKAMLKYLLHLPFFENPSSELLKMIWPILNKIESSPLIQLSVSNLVKNYCKNHANCLIVQEIQNFIKDVELILYEPIETDNFDKTLISLSVIGNVGYTYSIDLIRSIYLNESLPEIIRIAAIRSLKHMSCLIIQDGNLLDLFSNQENHDILRIEAFIVISKCLHRNEITKIAHTFSDEGVNRVTLFAWNYLTKMSKESVESIEAIQHIIKNNYLKHNFEEKDNSNPFISNLYNISLNENNDVSIITDRKDMTMKQFNLLSSINVFGRKFNVLKFDGFYKKVSAGMQKEKCSSNQGYNEKLNNNQEIDDSKENSISDTDLNNDISDFYAYISLLGNEVFLSNISFSHKRINQMYKKPLINYKQHVQVMDVSYIVSTATGLPLTFSISGDLDVSMITRVKYRDWSFCNFNPLKSSALKISMAVKSSISLVSFLEEIRVESLNLSENNPL